MKSGPEFAKDLEAFVTDKLSSLDLIKEPAVSADPPEVIRRLKIALKNELEASEVAALWIQTTPEVEIKLALARQAGDEAKHYKLIEKHLQAMNVDLTGFNPADGGYGPMFQLLVGFGSTVERIGAAQFTREALALKKNEQFIEFCEAAGDGQTAELYRSQIQPDEQWHVHLGREVLAKYATTPELQQKARNAVEAVLELAIKIQNKQVGEMKVSHAPGC
jgi:1,2-phenylacetyl-CoA epoxidase catalytic subunit